MFRAGMKKEKRRYMVGIVVSGNDCLVGSFRSAAASVKTIKRINDFHRGLKTGRKMANLT